MRPASAPIAIMVAEPAILPLSALIAVVAGTTKKIGRPCCRAANKPFTLLSRLPEIIRDGTRLGPFTHLTRVTCIQVLLMDARHLSLCANCHCLAARRRARAITRLFDDKLRPHG